MPPVPDRSTFENIYAGQPPWDIGRPQKAFIDVADQITGSILDAGCGTGENALYFAGRGCQVTGIDFIEEAVNRARRKATERGHAKFPVWANGARGGSVRKGTPALGEHSREILVELGFDDGEIAELREKQAVI